VYFKGGLNPSTGKVAFFLGYETLIGSDQIPESKYNSFFLLNGTNHKFKGLMDLFYVGNQVNSVGLNDSTKEICIKEVHFCKFQLVLALAPFIILNTWNKCGKIASNDSLAPRVEPGKAMTMQSPIIPAILLENIAYGILLCP
jgi:hypothetical protein